jgi:hypothetical protein
MIIKNIKKPSCFPYKEYTDKKDKVKLKACIYDEDDGGAIIVEQGSKQIYVREDASIKDWLKDIEINIKRQCAIRDFLKDVIKDRKAKKKEK